MVRLTHFQPTILLLCIASSACSKSRSDNFNAEEAAATRYREALATRPHSSADAVIQALDAGTLKLDAPDDLPDPDAERECPATSNWQSIDDGQPTCGFTWTADKSQLPISPEWRPCQAIEGIARGTCKELGRHHRLKSIHVGLDAAKKIQIGFVENCQADQIVLTDADGTARFALRRAGASANETTCQVKLLAVDVGQWLAAIGGHDAVTSGNAPGYTMGGAFVGGTIGAPPNILYSTKKDPFHVATSQGTVGIEGWAADGKRRAWTGNALEKPPRIGWQYVSKDLFFDPQKGFFGAKKTDPLYSIAKDSKIRHVLVRDKQLVWLDESTKVRPKTCALYASELDGRDTLTTPRRVTELPCPSSGFVFGCNAVLSGSETQISMVSLTSGALRILRIRGRAAAIDCEDAYIERNGTLLRVNLAAFGVPKLQGFELGH